MALAPERLSRFLTFLLRHKPKDYPLAIDSEGFAPWQRCRRPGAAALLRRDRGADTRADRRRGEKALRDSRRQSARDLRPFFSGRSRRHGGGAAGASYYFGAARDLAQSMLRRGLEPRDRQYVHLSVTAEEAESVARRHDPAPAILVIDAQAAHAEGMRFYESGPLFLVENVPAKFLSLR